MNHPLRSAGFTVVFASCAAMLALGACSSRFDNESVFSPRPGQSSTPTPTTQATYIHYIGSRYDKFAGPIIITPLSGGSAQALYPSDVGLQGTISFAVDAQGALFVLGFTQYGPAVSVVPPAVPGGTRASSLTIALPIVDNVAFYYDIAVDRFGLAYIASVDSGGVGRILVYSPGSKSAASPVRIISGSMTQLFAPYALATGKAGDLYVLNFQSCQPSGGSCVSILRFLPLADGNQVPTNVIAGNNTGFGPAAGQFNSASGIAVDAADEIFVAVGNDANGSPSQISVFGPGQRGDIAAQRIIGGSNASLGGLATLAVDSIGTIYAATNAVQFQDPVNVRVFAAGASGNVPPNRTIVGASALGGAQKVVVGPW